MWQREQAVGLFAQLPELLADKMLVLEEMSKLLDWVHHDELERFRGSSVVPLRAGVGASPNN